MHVYSCDFIYHGRNWRSKMKTREDRLENCYLDKQNRGNQRAIKQTKFDDEVMILGEQLKKLIYAKIEIHNLHELNY